MSITMFKASVPVLLHGLSNLQHIIGKAQAHAAEKQIEPSALINARLFPDMLPFARQIHIATDIAKGCAGRLAAVEAPKFDDVEFTFDELDARLQKTIDFLKTFGPEQIDGSEERGRSRPLCAWRFTENGADARSARAPARGLRAASHALTPSDRASRLPPLREQTMQAFAASRFISTAIRISRNKSVRYAAFCH